MALSDVTGQARLHGPVVRDRAVTALGTILPLADDVDHEVVTVNVGRCDDALAHRRAPSLIKCDVEGVELRVFRGAETSLRRSKPALVVKIEQRHQSAPVDETFTI
jgi:FkbM family methyltransferase